MIDKAKCYDVMIDWELESNNIGTVIDWHIDWALESNNIGTPTCIIGTPDFYIRKLNKSRETSESLYQ